MSKTLPAHIALLTVNMIYGANYLVAKGLMPDVIGPSGFILLRALGAVLLFWLIKLFVKEKIKRADIWRLVACGAFGVAINQLLFFNGLNITSPINASIIMTSNPILVLVIASVILKERITKLKLTGVTLGAIGAITLILTSSKEANSTSSILGDTFCFINAVSYGIYLVMVKPLMAKYKPITVVSYVFAFGSLFVLPFGFKEFTEVSWATLSKGHVLSMIYVVVGTTFLAYLLNIFALKHVTPSIASSYIYLQPVMAALFGFLFFHFASGFPSPGVITPTKIICTVLIFAGVYLVSKPNKQQGAS